MEIDESTIKSLETWNTTAVKDFRNGDETAREYLCGALMRASAGEISYEEASEALDEHFRDNSDTVEVRLPYDDYYNFNEKVECIDGIPDTDAAYEMFKYPPSVDLICHWDKTNNDLTPVRVEIDGEEYDI